jgi:hypothetical protein
VNHRLQLTGSVRIPGRGQIVVGILLLGAVLALRLFWIESRTIGEQCLMPEAPFGCLLRSGVILLFHYHLFSVVTLACAAMAWYREEARWATAAVLAGVVGMVLYNTVPSSVGFLAGLLWLAGHPSPGPGASDRCSRPVVR